MLSTSLSQIQQCFQQTSVKFNNAFNKPQSNSTILSTPLCACGAGTHNFLAQSGLGGWCQYHSSCLPFPNTNLVMVVSKRQLSLPFRPDGCEIEPTTTYSGSKYSDLPESEF
ncbi:hypothetical protein BsWGS_20109 [Bradybaena similaris]